MIISASRRTDIPAFYSDWFINRLKEGFVLVKNPMNANQLSKVNLLADAVDCIVFWTKNPAKMINNLDYLDRYRYQYYFQFTLNPYNSEIEPNVPEKAKLIETFKTLSNRIGCDRVVWRYDPILLTEKIDIAYHAKYFEYLAEKLSGYTSRCMISFVDIYRNVNSKIKTLNVKAPSDNEMLVIAGKIAAIASKYNIKIETCAEQIDLSSVGIQHGRCVDDVLISNMLGVRIEAEKDKTQRDMCGCIRSVDIGEYNTCPHQCSYCYANFSNISIERNIKAHNDAAPLLVGHVTEKHKITDRKVDLLKTSQGELFVSST